MYITYHKEVSKPDHLNQMMLIPHDLLCDPVKHFLVMNNCKQERYFISNSWLYSFLYLDNGDRVDIQL